MSKDNQHSDLFRYNSYFLKYFAPMMLWIIVLTYIIQSIYELPRYILYLSIAIEFCLALFPLSLCIYEIYKYKSVEWIDENKEFKNNKKSYYFFISQIIIALGLFLLYAIIRLYGLATTPEEYKFLTTYIVIILFAFIFAITSLFIFIRNISKHANILHRFVSANFNEFSENLQNALKEHDLLESHKSIPKSLLVASYSKFSIKNSKVEINLISKKEGFQIRIIKIDNEEIPIAEKLKNIIDELMENN